MMKQQTLILFFCSLLCNAYAADCSDPQDRSVIQLRDYKTFDDAYEEYGSDQGALCGRDCRLFPGNFLAVQAWITHLFSDSVFVDDACCGKKKISIPDFVFGKDIEIQDIFLASKLAAEGKFTLPGQPAFGQTPDEQYIACTADTKLTFNGFMRQTAAELSLFYTFNAYHCLKLACGFYIPIKHQERYLILDCIAGHIACGQATQPIGENNVTQFFNDFIDVNDYIFRGILEPKCISCLLTQSRTGLGDVSFATIVDVGGYSDYLQLARFGLIGILPTGHIRSGNILWEVELGTGAFAFKPFIDIHTLTGYRYVNPRLYLAVSRFMPFTGMRRIPQRKDTKSELLIPSRFEPFNVAPFDDFDVTKREFADQASKTRIQYGTQVDLVVGNLAFNVLDSAFSAGLFYEGTYKSRDSLRVICPKTAFNTDLLTSITDEIAHAIRWNVQWSWDGNAVFELGSHHVLGGRNAFNIHEIFGSVIIYY